MLWFGLTQRNRLALLLPRSALECGGETFEGSAHRLTVAALLASKRVYDYPFGPGFIHPVWTTPNDS